VLNCSTLDKLNNQEQDGGRFSPGAGWGGMDRSSISRVSVADQVAAILRQQILNGELRPGTALAEIPLAAQLGVARNTMREAVRILCLEGLLKRNIHRGVAVSRLSRKDVREIYDLRRMIEVQAVLSAKHRPPELMDGLRAAVDFYECSVRARDWSQAVARDFEFHSLVVRLRGNQRLEAFYHNVIGELRMGMVLVDRSHDDPGALVPVHRKLYQLLQAGKLKQCAQLLVEHLDDSEARLGGIMAGEVDSMARGKSRRGRERASGAAL
jgi:DNA-binding GntR family transcriptional regulator